MRSLLVFTDIWDIERNGMDWGRDLGLIHTSRMDGRWAGSMVFAISGALFQRCCRFNLRGSVG